MDRVTLPLKRSWVPQARQTGLKEGTQLVEKRSTNNNRGTMQHAVKYTQIQSCIINLTGLLNLDESERG